MWPGLAKLAEECGELVQVIGKIMAYPDASQPHPDGSDLVKRLQVELGDLQAAADYVLHANDAMDISAVASRRWDKVELFMSWHNRERRP